MNLAVARALTQARKDADFTNESLAAVLPDISLTSLQRYLSGRSAIDVEVLSQICTALGIDERQIMVTAQKLRDETAADAGADAAIAHLDKHLGRNPRGKGEMQQMGGIAARDDSKKPKKG